MQELRCMHRFHKEVKRLRLLRCLSFSEHVRVMVHEHSFVKIF